MEARTIVFALVLSTQAAFSTSAALGATHNSPNFVVYAPTAEIAAQVSAQAEKSRVRLAREWLQTELPKWGRPCYITVQVGQIGAGGETTFMFDNGEVYGWKMRVQGTLERILDSVIPHEVSHTIFASYFRRPLPRWADEGAATLTEHESERRRQTLTFKQVFHTKRRIPLNKLLAMKEYPTDMQSVLTLYAEGYSLADYLVQMGGKKRFLHFLSEAEKSGWETAIAKFYKIKGIAHLENEWDQWFLAGSPEMNNPNGTLLASNSWRRNTPGSDVVLRSQSPDHEDDSSTPAAQQQVAVNQSGRSARPAASRAPSPFGDETVASTASMADERPVVVANNESSSADRSATVDWNDDWNAKPAPQRRRPQPLIGRIEWDRNDGNARQTSSRPTGEEETSQSLPLASRDVGSPDRVFEQEQDLSWDPIPSWSQFPQRRSNKVDDRLGQASAVPVSP